ncbi:MAG: type II toxin-antitoxin system RelE/ParE family toxin [Coriobacteriales bacterium]|jgi:proteic killer suppression protein|nr:type II toxin-antitoxin system RelE/ParE family toxin [Coriobacteriales bacterium]
MIKTFANNETEKIFLTGQSKKLPPETLDRAIRKLDMIDSAQSINDLRVPPGNKLHALKGSGAGQQAISINDQWRVCFTFDEENAFDGEICDYH